MPVEASHLESFAVEVRRLAGTGEPPLYPAYKVLLEAVYPDHYAVDILLRAPGAGFPDITVSRGPRIVNWVEIKHPGVSVDPLPGPDAERFGRYCQALPHIVLTNGWCWRLFEKGTETSRVDLPPEWLTGATALTSSQNSELKKFLARVSALSPSAATSYDEAVRLLAVSAQLVEGALLDAVQSGLPQPLAEARDSFTDLLRTNPADTADIEDDRFADVLAQTCVFGYLLARVEKGADITPDNAPAALDTAEHPFLKTALHAMVAPDEDLEARLGGALRAACDAINGAASKLAGPKGDWEKVPYVYEEFFSLYKPADRFELGVFYTPEIITRFQVQDIQRGLREDLGLTGLTDPSVRFLEPACGTGTYLLALAEEARLEAEELGLPISTTLLELFRDRVVGFEVSPGPASVAQARLTAWLRLHGVKLETRFPVFVVNTLSPPAAGGGPEGPTTSLWAENISKEQHEGDSVKRERPIIVIFGNPPWGDRPRATFATGNRTDDNIIAEWATGAGAAVINLYDLYVAFWRFAVGMLLDRPGVQPPVGIVSFITNRSWLRGRAYRTMRDWMRTRNVQADLIDLGGDIRAGATAQDEPVFAIKAGSAISRLTFTDQHEASRIKFRRIRGNRLEKLDALQSHSLPDAVEVDVPNQSHRAFGPIDWGTLGHGIPIADFFAINFPGVKTHRDPLVIDVNRDGLLATLRNWNALDKDERGAAFHPSRDRQTPGELTIDPDKVILHRYRPLDERFLYGDRDFIDQPGRAFRHFKASPGAKVLISMDTRTSAGPVVIASCSLPGYNSFRGSYETHVYPLSPDVDQEQGQLATEFAEVLSPGAALWASDLNASPEEVGAYLLALGNAPSYAEAFIEPLENDMVRFPAITDPELFQEAAEIGARLLKAWSLNAPRAGRWREAGPGIQLGEAKMEGDAILFENGDRLKGIQLDVWTFSVSGYPVMQRYLEARAHLALSGNLANEIRATAGAIAAIIKEQQACDELLERAIAAPSTPFFT